MSSMLNQWFMFLIESPALRLMQLGLLTGGLLLIYLVFYATRDILLRTNSLVYQFVSIVLVATMPIVGFLVYLLIRPARTMKEREVEAMLKQIIANEAKQKAQKKVSALPRVAVSEQPVIASRAFASSTLSKSHA